MRNMTYLFFFIHFFLVKTNTRIIMLTLRIFSVITLILIFHSIDGEILFQNGFVTCYSDRLVIPFYYFPYGDKTIEYKNIRSCDLLDAKQLSFFEVKSWGMAFSSIWWPLDIRRQWRKYYIVIDANQWPRIGLTMDDEQIHQVYKLIKDLT